MREEKKRDSAVCELLLVLYFVGALLCVLYRRGIFDLELPLTGDGARWIAALLALDAFMAGSLLCLFVLPLTTLAFGAVSVLVGTRILVLDELWRRWLLLLLLAVPLHFLLGGWSLSTMAEIRRDLIGRGHRRAVFGVAALMTVGGLLASALVMYLFQRGLIE